jgi:hypothetical protein
MGKNIDCSKEDANYSFPLNLSKPKLDEELQTQIGLLEFTRRLVQCFQESTTSPY